MPHLDLQDLGPNVKKKLDSLGDWLSNKEFVKLGENLEMCNAEGLKSEITALLPSLEFVKNDPHYTVLRSTGSSPAKVRNSLGPAQLISIRVRGGDPSISTRKAVVGQAVYITEPVDVGPGLDFIIIVP